MQKEKDGFKSKFGFIMAAAGSAVGLGNLWSFPCKTGSNGGAAFVIIYVIMALLIGVVGMVAEMYIGKRSGKNILDSYKSVHKGFTWVGALGVLSTTIIASYYIVLGGWVLKYCWSYLVGTPVYIGDGNYAGYFGQFISNSWEPILFLAIFFILAMIILVFGVQKGIERISKILMPLLLVLMIVLMIRSLTLDNSAGVQEGLEFYLKPDFSKLTPKVVLAAMGQSFFSLSLGVGTMCVYGSYAEKQDGLGKSAVSVVVLDTLVALLAGFMIFPAIFAFGHGSDSAVMSGGPGLFFATMPQIFDQMPGGRFFGFTFFFLVFVAAITSIISMVEVALQTTIEKTKIKRPIAVVIFTVIILLFGCIVSLSQGAVPELQLKPIKPGAAPVDLLTFFDSIIQTYVMPLGTIIACVLVGWVIKKNEIDENFADFKLKKVWMFLVKYVTPILVGAILLAGMFTWGGEEGFGLVDWRITLTGFVVIAAFVIGNLIINAINKKALGADLKPAYSGEVAENSVVEDVSTDNSIDENKLEVVNEESAKEVSAVEDIKEETPVVDNEDKEIEKDVEIKEVESDKKTDDVANEENKVAEEKAPVKKTTAKKSTTKKED